MIAAELRNNAPFRGKSRKVWKWTDFFKDTDAEPRTAISAKVARARMLSIGSAMQAFEDRRAKSKTNPARTDEAQQGS